MYYSSEKIASRFTTISMISKSARQKAAWKITREQHRQKPRLFVWSVTSKFATFCTDRHHFITRWLTKIRMLYCLLTLSPWLFYLFLKEIMTNAPEDFIPSISIGGKGLRNNLRDAGYIDLMGGGGSRDSWTDKPTGHSRHRYGYANL